MKFPPNSIEEFKTTYHNYGTKFWTQKRCNICQEQFTAKNQSQKQIELIACKVVEVDEYHASEGIEIKWYHKTCLTRLADIFKNYEIPT